MLSMTRNKIARRGGSSWKEERLHESVNYVFVTCIVAIGLLLFWRVFSTLVRRTRRKRHLINNVVDLQTSSPAAHQPSRISACLKKHVLYAPIFQRRKNEDIIVTAGARLNLGTLPSRLEALFILAYVSINMVLCFTHIDYTPTKGVILYAIRNRCGAVAVANMIPLFLLATRNNPLIRILDLSFDTYNLLHRWLGRVVVVDLFIHVFAWIAGAYAKSKGDTILEKIQTDDFYAWGLVAGCPMVLMVILAWSPIRHAFYEVFLQLHRAFAIVSIIGLWYHLKRKQYYEIQVLFAVIAIWAAERAARLVRLAYRNIGTTMSTAEVEVLAGDVMRVTVQLARPWKLTPGQHAYIFMPKISLFASHPFSVAWSGTAQGADLEAQEVVPADQKQEGGVISTTLPTPSQDQARSGLSFIMRAHDGFTRSLLDHALKKTEVTGSVRFTTACFLEGPYRGNHNDMDSYSSVVLFAGGVGITHQLPFLQHLLAGLAAGRVATRRLLLVWVVHSAEHVEWVSDWLDEVFAMPQAREVLRVHVFVSQPGSPLVLPGLAIDDTLQVFAGRPSPTDVLEAEIKHHTAGVMGVSVCGPGGLSDDVRLAVRERQELATIDYIEESFSW